MISAVMKQLANLYYSDGKDREAAITFNTLIQEKPLSPGEDHPGGGLRSSHGPEEERARAS